MQRRKAAKARKAGGPADAYEAHDAEAHQLAPAIPTPEPVLWPPTAAAGTKAGAASQTASPTPAATGPEPVAAAAQWPAAVLQSAAAEAGGDGGGRRVKGRRGGKRQAMKVCNAAPV